MAKNLKLTVLCGEYESVRALREGTVKAKGIDLEFVRYPGTTGIHSLVARDQGADISEYNGGAYIIAKSLGRPYTALPIFLHRRFRHGFIYVSKKSGIEKPTDLIGKRMGSRTYTSAAEFWMRGILEEDYNVSADSMQWTLQDKAEVPFKPAKGVKTKMIGSGKTIKAAFLKGDIDAFMSPDLLPEITKKDLRVRRLFPDHQNTEKAYFERTGLFPIMHVTTIRSELIKKEPWIVKSLVTAFEESKQYLFSRIANPRIVPLAWWTENWAAERELLGPDPWEHGLSDLNLRNYGKMVEFVNRQIMLKRKMKIENLFPKEAFEIKAPFKIKYRSDEKY